ncbi:MAG: type II toxin-antitoxin system HicA family toxin [Spirochaetia bacterium]|nr:type II toxin-antitoxin system HicA family toxin [Spirochaetia bacterium]
MKSEKLLRKIINSQSNIRFEDFIKLIKEYGFIQSRVKGSHHIFKHPEVEELINIQNAEGKAKPYQIKQFISIIEKYDLKLKK